MPVLAATVATESAVTAIADAVTGILPKMMTNVGTVVDTIVSTPYLLFWCVGIPFFGVAISIIGRLKNA